MARYIFTGAQGTGKTTILNHFRENGANVITEVVRNLTKQGVPINEQGTQEGQTTIFNEYVRLLSEQGPYISDRGLTDVTAYSYCLADSDKLPYSYAEAQLEQVKQFVKDNPDVVYFYFPIEFAVVNDGVRSTNEGFRTAVDQYIKYILKEAGIPYVEVRGTVEERIKIVLGTMSITESK